MDNPSREVECRMDRYAGGLACGRCEDCCANLTSRAETAEARVAELESTITKIKELGGLEGVSDADLVAHVDRRWVKYDEGLNDLRDAKARVAELEESIESHHRPNEHELMRLREYLRQEHERPNYAEIDGESRGPVGFAIDTMNGQSERVAELESDVGLKQALLDRVQNTQSDALSARNRAEARVAELEAEVMPMRHAFGRLRSSLRLSDVAGMDSVVRSVNGNLDDMYELRSEVTRLEGLLRISADTNSKLISQIADQRKEGE